ncbi:MAG: hypothetical protein N2316_08275 [Spirochaetes bacterium]|nr:hypothetical protein [Spirochaetota bacterium]
MKKKILICLCAAILGGAHAFATSTRDMGMGLFEYPWFVDGLQTYMYENPAYLPSFNERAYAERIGVVSGYNMGGIILNPAGKVFLGFNFGIPVDNNVWNTTAVDGLFHVDTYAIHAKSNYTHSKAPTQSFGGYQVELLNEEILDLKDPADASYPVGTNTESSDLREELTQRNFSAMVAYDFGRFILGFDVGYATSWVNNKESDSTINAKEEYNLVNTEYSARVGCIVKINPQVDIDFGGNFVLYALDNNYSKYAPGLEIKTDYKTKGAMDFGGFARVNYQMTTRHKSHFYAAYKMLNRSTEGSMKISDTANPTKNVDAEDTFERTGQLITIGVSDEYAFSPEVKAFLGFATIIETFKNNYYGIDAIVPANNVDKYKYDYTSVKVPLILGLEAKLTETWRGRFGVRQTIYQPLTSEGESITGQGTVTTPASVSEISSAQTAFSLGLSYRLGAFTFDWLGNLELFTIGPYFVSGMAWTSTQRNPLAMAFAVTYKFGDETKESSTILAPK